MRVSPSFGLNFLNQPGHLLQFFQVLFVIGLQDVLNLLGRDGKRLVELVFGRDRRLLRARES